MNFIFIMIKLNREIMALDSDYKVRLATLEAMGGDVTKDYDSVYDVDLAILKKAEEGGGGGGGLTPVIVDELPETGEAGKMYFVPNPDPSVNNNYLEYLWVNKKWENVGSAAVDISSKQDKLVSGTNIKTINGSTLLGAGDMAVQETLVSGTNIKTINGLTLLGEGDIEVADKNGVFITYGTTLTSEESAELYDIWANHLNKKVYIKNPDAYNAFYEASILYGSKLYNDTGYIIIFVIYNSSIRSLNGKPRYITYSWNSALETWQESVTDLQQALVSGTNIKTINGNDILGSGDITISGGAVIDDENASTGTVYSSAKTDMFFEEVIENQEVRYWPNEQFWNQYFKSSENLSSKFILEKDGNVYVDVNYYTPANAKTIEKADKTINNCIMEFFIYVKDGFSSYKDDNNLFGQYYFSVSSFESVGGEIQVDFYSFDDSIHYEGVGYSRLIYDDIFATAFGTLLYIDNFSEIGTSSFHCQIAGSLGLMAFRTSASTDYTTMIEKHGRFGRDTTMFNMDNVYGWTYDIAKRDGGYLQLDSMPKYVTNFKEGLPQVNSMGLVTAVTELGIKSINLNGIGNTPFPCYTYGWGGDADFEIYAPTTTGNSGQIVKSTGSAPEWTSIKTINNETIIGSGNINLVKTTYLTQDEYDALTTKDANTLYIITDE